MQISLYVKYEWNDLVNNFFGLGPQLIFHFKDVSVYLGRISSISLVSSLWIGNTKPFIDRSLEELDYGSFCLLNTCGLRYMLCLFYTIKNWLFVHAYSLIHGLFLNTKILTLFWNVSEQRGRQSRMTSKPEKQYSRPSSFVFAGRIVANQKTGVTRANNEVYNTGLKKFRPTLSVLVFEGFKQRIVGKSCTLHFLFLGGSD